MCVHRAVHHEGSFHLAPDFLFTSHLGSRRSGDNHCEEAASSPFCLGTDPHTSRPSGTLPAGSSTEPLTGRAAHSPAPHRQPVAQAASAGLASPALLAVLHLLLGRQARAPPNQPSLALWPLWGPHLTAVLAADPWLCPLPSPQPSFQGQSEVSAIFETRRLPAAAGLPERRLPRLRMGPPPPDSRAASDRGSGGFGTLLLLLLPNMVLSKTQARLSFLRQQSNKPLSARQLLL